MNSLGRLIDRLIIAKLKYDKTKSSEVKEYCDYLLAEFDKCIDEIASGEEMFQEPMFKVYSGKKEPMVKVTSTKEAIKRLAEANRLIWGLEDLRRKEDISAEEIVEINEISNKYNSIRNNMISEIDRLCRKK